MFKKYRICRLEKKIRMSAAKIEELRKAEREYGRSYYTNRLIEEVERLSGFEFDLLKIKGDL